MKATLFLVLFSLALVLAQVPGGVPVASWAGSLVNVSTSWSGVPNVVQSTQACSITNQTSASNYVVVNTTFTTAGPYQALAFAVNNINLFVYNGSFNPQDPCGNLRAEMILNNGALNYYGPDVEDTYWFSTGVTYFFVIAADSTVGDFSLGLYFLNVSGAIGSTNTWSPFTMSSSACSQITTNVPYASYQWTAAATGLVDIFAGFPVNTTGSWSNSYIAVFPGAMTATQLNSDTLCQTQAGITYNGPESGRAAHLYGVRVTAGQVYTVVVSGSTATSFANYGISVVTSRLVPASFLATGFVLPSIGSLPCTVGTSYTNQSYVATTVTTASNNYKVLVSLPTLSSGSNTNWTTASSSDSAGFVYQGLNIGSAIAAPATCPAATPLVASTTSFPASLNSAASTQYSLIAAYWASGSGLTSYNAFIVYVQTGAPAGSFTPSNPTTSTGSGATGGGVASGTHSTIGNFTTGTTSSSSSVVCSFVFVVLAIIALMF
jgi:hypothetical protein